jgi:hypothetical protein
MSCGIGMMPSDVEGFTSRCAHASYRRVDQGSRMRSGPVVDILRTASRNGLSKRYGSPAKRFVPLGITTLEPDGIVFVVWTFVTFGPAGIVAVTC